MENADAATSFHAPRTTHFVPDVHLTEYGGHVFDLSAQRGNVVLLFFGYTRCPDVCPTTLADFAGVDHRLGPRADHVKFVFISVDPARDTPLRAAEYARGFDRSFIGLSGDSASVFVIGKDGTVTETLRFAGPQEDALYELTDNALKASGPAQLSPRNPWVRSQPDAHLPAAAYISLDNPGDKTVLVTAVGCAGAGSVTIHVSSDSGGMMRMTPLRVVVVPASGGVTMAPGGIHLMLAGLRQPLRPGDHVDCTLQTSAGEVSVSAPVRDR